MKQVQILFRVVPILALGLSGCLDQPSLHPLAKMPVAPVPETISVEILEYTPTSGRIFKDLFVSNFSVTSGRGQLSLTGSRDSLSDSFKEAHFVDYGFSAAPNPDSNNDGFSDLFVYLLGIPLTQQNTLFCAPNLKQNKSGDAFVYEDPRLPGPPVVLGLRDCEKNYLGLDPERFDFDGDGIPDYLELRAGLNPKNPKDANLNPAGDGMPNIEKIKRHLPVDENSKSQPNKLFAYQYKTELNKDGTYKFAIKNIGILNGGQDNFIAFYITETDPSQNRYVATAYVRLTQNLASKVLKFNYWGTDPAKATNQEIIIE